MIELTEQQLVTIAATAGGPAQAINPLTRATYVLLPIDEYRRLAGAAYDDSGWTRDELHAAAWEAGQSIGWDEMAEYDPAAQP